MSRHEGCDRCTETAAVVRREVAALTAERDEARAKLDALGEPDILHEAFPPFRWREVFYGPWRPVSPETTP